MKRIKLSKNIKILILNLPSPPKMDVCRDFAGGYGVAWPAKRGSYGQSRKPIFNPFIPYIMTSLSGEGLECYVIDGQQKKLDDKGVIQYVNKINPDLIISMIGLPSIFKDVQILNQIKIYHPDCLIVGVGTVCHTLTQSILSNSRVDILVKDLFPYSFTTTELIKAIIKGRNLKKVPGISCRFGKSIFGTQESLGNNIDKLPFPDYDQIEINGYDCFRDNDWNYWNYIAILTGIGCPYACFYCPYPIGFGKKWLPKSPKNIVDEIESLYSRGIKGFTFRDQLFTMNKKRVMDICREIITRKLDVAWICEARVDQISKDMLNLMERSGCKRINYGVETGATELIEEAKSGVNLTIINKAFQLTKSSGILAGAHIIIGWPEENLRTIQATYELISKIDPDHINLNILTPYPGTLLYNFAKKRHLIASYDWTKYTSHSVVMKSKWLNADQLQEAVNNIVRENLKRETIKLLRLAHKNPMIVVKGFMDILRSTILS